MPLTDVFTDDFESGDPLTTRWTRSGFGNPVVAAGVGRDGGYGVQCAGPSTSQSGRIKNATAFSPGTRTGVVQWDLWLPTDGLTAIGTPYWFDLIGPSGVGHILGFNLTGAAAPYDLTTQGYTGSGTVHSGVVPGGSFIKLRAVFTLSTTLTSADGELRIYVGPDATSLTLVHEETGVNFNGLDGWAYTSLVCDRNGFLDNVDVGTSVDEEGGDEVIPITGVTLTINEIDKDIRHETLQINQTVSGAHTLSCEIMSEDGSDRPAVGDEIVCREDGERVFAGLIQSTTELALGAIGDEPITTRISASDYRVLASSRVVSGSFTGVTLQAFLQALIDDYLTESGTTLHPDQAVGPTLPDVTYSYRVLADVLDDVCRQISPLGEGYVWEIDYFNRLRVFQPSAEAAVFDILDTNDHALGDLEVERSKAEGYANRVIVIAAPGTMANYTQTWTGDGVQTVFAVDVPAAVIPQSGDLWPGVCFVDGVQFPIFFPGDPNDGNRIVWDAAAGTLSFNGEFAAYVTPTAGAEIVLTFSPLGVAIAPQGSPQPEEPEEVVINLSGDQIITQEALQAIADAELEARNQLVTRTRYITHDQGLKVGQTQRIQHAPRNLDATFVIQEIDIRDLVPSADDFDQPAVLERTISALSRSDDKGNWRTQWTGGSSTSGGGSIAGSASAPVGTSTAGAVTHTTADLTANQLVVGNGTNDLKPLGAAGTGVQVLHGNASGAPSFGAVALASDVSGILPIANGGTGQTAKTAAFDALAPTTTKGDLVVHDGTNNVRKAVGSNGQVLTADSTATGGVKWAAVGSGSTRAITFAIDGGGVALTTGIKADVSVPVACTITGARLLADQSGSVVVDIWKDTYANYPPTVADTITASAKPTLSSATKSDDTTLTGWTTSISAGDTLRFNIDSVATITRLVLVLTVTV